MSYGQFIVSAVNPNDTTGGGGCACDPRKQDDCKPPYIVCYGNDMFDHRSPHVVICQSCVFRMKEMLGGEQLEAGERGAVIKAERPAEHRSRKSPPVVESPDPTHDFDDTPDI